MLPDGRWRNEADEIIVAGASQATTLRRVMQLRQLPYLMVTISPLNVPPRGKRDTNARPATCADDGPVKDLSSYSESNS
jgi:hypothetical protein